MKRLNEDSLESALKVLRVWLPPSRHPKATAELVEQVKALGPDQAIEAVKELKRPRRFIRRLGGNQLSVDITMGRLDNGESIRTKALVDSGCSGSCVDRDFVAKNEIPVRRLPLPIPVYNADGTINKGGSITDVVELRLTI